MKLGWLYPPGDMKAWDGLLGWFIDQANADRAVLDDPDVGQWFTTSHSVAGQL
ncbi:MAG: hypothetical protein ACREDT_15230 [Methylocella sp.]